MEFNKNNSVTLTQKRIASAKGLHLICAIVAMVLNIIAFTVLAVNVTASEIMFLVFPAVLAVLDVLFLVKVIFSNYRFRYAVNGAVIHSVTVLLVSVFAYAVMGMLEEKNGIVFVTFAMYAMLIVHVAQSVATLATALYATKSRKGAAKVCGMLFTVVFLVLAGIYGRMLLVDGYFGQGGYTEYRTVVYKYDAQNKNYTAVDVLDGYGTDVVIPHQFNGSHVSHIDCALFAHEELTSVEVAWADNDDCSEKLGFVGVEHLNFLNPELKLLAPRGYMDGFRRALYTLSEQNRYALDLANHVYPSDIKNNEVYISFGYDADTLALVGVDNIIPVWIKEQGTEFNVKDHTNVSYIKNSDAANAAQLVWCHQYQQEQIFKCIIDENGNEISGAINKSIVNAKVVFEKLYHLEIMADNESPDKTTIKNEHRYMYDGKEKIFDYVITTAGNMQSKLDAIKPRAGFTLAWLTGTETNKHALDLAEELALLDASGHNTLTVYPEWTLLPPTIDSITAGGNASGITAVYGSDVELGSAATPPAEGISIKYEWFYEDGTEPVASANSHTLKNIYPENFAGDFVKAGTYKLVVTAGNDEVTKLTSTAEKTIEVGFNKKALDFTWALPEGADAIYSASLKNSIIENTTYITADVINGDEISFSILSNGTALNVKDAGTYELKLELSGNTALLYEIKEDKVNNSVTIAPCPIDAVWGEEDKFTYNGKLQAPTASVTSPYGEDVSVKVLGAEQNYKNGGYVATAELDGTNSVNKNYVLREGTETKPFEILKRKITINSWDTNAFVYNSKPQRPSVIAINNLVEGENIASDIIYSGQQTYVGGYVVTASLSDDYNYEFEGTVEYAYEITKRPLRVTIESENPTYNGLVFKDFTYKVGTAAGEGVAENDKIAEIFEIEYTGNAVTATDVNEGGYVIDAVFKDKGKLDNYELTYTQGTLTFKKRPVTITIANINKTYDGEKFTENDIIYKVGNGNIIEADEGFVFRMEYSCELFGKAGYADGVRYGSWYDIEATIVPDGNRAHNYEINDGNYTLKPQVKMTQKTITLQTIQRDSNGKIYDGKNADIREFGYIADDVIEKDRSCFDTIIYDCEALSTKKVGEYKIRYSFDTDNYDIQSVIANYHIASSYGIYTVNPKEVTVTLNPVKAEYTGYVFDTGVFSPAFDQQYNVSGLVSGDDFGVPTFAGAALTAKNVNDGGYLLQITRFNGADVGNYSFSESSKLTTTFTITPRPVIVEIYNKEVTYGNGYSYNVNELGIQYVYGGNWNVANDTLGGLDAEFVFSTNNNICTPNDVGAYTVSVEFGNKNYEINTLVNGILTINKRTVYIIAANAEKTYDAQPYPYEKFTAIVDGTRGEGLASGESLAALGMFEFSGPAISATDWNANGYEIYANCIPKEDGIAKNYNIVCDNTNAGKLIINKREVQVTVNAMNPHTYDGNAYKDFSVTIVNAIDKADENKIRGDIAYRIDDSDVKEAVNVGKYTVSAYLKNADDYSNNYYVRFTSATLEILQKEISIVVMPAEKTYDGGYSTPEFKITVPEISLDEAESEQFIKTLGTIAYTGANNAKNAGKYTIRAYFANTTEAYKNYKVVSYVDGTYTINPKEIDVRVDDGEAEYSGNAFNVGRLVLTYVKDQIIGSDRLGDPSYEIRKGNPDGDVVTSAIDAGKYYVTVSYPNGNYTVKCTPGEVTITKRSITVTAVAGSKTYDGTSNNSKYLNGEITSGELASRDIVNAQLPFGGYTLSGEAVQAINVGEYTLAVEFKNHESASLNYNITYETATFTITPAELTVTAVAEDRVYDGTANNVYSVTVEGLAGGDTLADLGYVKYDDGTAGGAVEAGKYTLNAEITYGTEEQKAKAANYKITYIPCEFAINVSPEDTWGSVETTSATTAATDIKYK